MEIIMELMYKSTRSENETVTASQAILKGLASDGGLFVPTSIPKLNVSLDELAKMSYKETAYVVMKEFLTDFTEEELKACIDKAYDSKFDTEEIAPLVKAEGAYYLELFHGATIAFKDMALSILPHLLTTSAKKNNVKNEIVILTATSGDTGKAALAGFANVPGTRIVVFYPKGGVSPIQEKQMVTQKGDNTFVVGINGNFDQAQSGVKAIFADKELEKEMDKAGFQFSSANSINIGRLVPQVVYYVYAYVKLLANEEIAKDEKINVVVPTGNFGNILAAYYAKNMGLPIDKLICASNDNKVLYDFFTTGTYDKNREFILTTSPSMDILISSNLERLIYKIAGNDASKNKELMISLNTYGKYDITDEMKSQLKDFYGNYATEAETSAIIKEIYEATGYIIDTHTAVAAVVYKKYIKDTQDSNKCVIASTASPFKFTRSVMNSIDSKYDSMGDFELVDELSKIGNVKVPNAIEEIRNADILHNTVCEVAEMPDVVKKFLNI
jgi:threonine synthase